MLENPAVIVLFACEMKTKVIFVLIRDGFDTREHWMYYLGSKLPKSTQMAEK